MKQFIVPLTIVLMLLSCLQIYSQGHIKALVLTERGGQHEGFVTEALKWLNNYSQSHDFKYNVINNTAPITADYLKQYNLFIQLNYPPYTWSSIAEAAFIDYIENGKGGWIGFHHATLLGEFDGYPMWNWFSEFMGGIRFKNYIAAKATGTVHIEDNGHPITSGLPHEFDLPDDEWYTFNKSPRPNVHVLANVDEESYDPPSDIKMGAHPVAWINETKKARNVYFLFGHDAKLFTTEEFKVIFSNAIKWASEKG